MRSLENISRKGTEPHLCREMGMEERKKKPPLGEIMKNPPCRRNDTTLSGMLPGPAVPQP